MEKLKHTEGEWELIGREIKPMGLTSTITVVQLRTSKEETEANAKLISASPNLLGALIKLVKKYEFNMNSTQRANIELDEEYIESINAINKATE
jgi:regulator of PEP synthase PpsR (kinase-PPPase family)